MFFSLNFNFLLSFIHAIRFRHSIITVVLFLFFLLFSPVQAVQPTGQSDSWNLIFSDEFDANSLNTTVWEPSWFGGNGISNPINSDEDGCYDPAQVSMSGGTLKLTAAATTKTNCKIRSGATAKYASGLVNTRKSFLFAYGYMEARLYTPGSNGDIWNWPAFWSDGTGTWPVTGEIDVMESLSGHQPCWHYHYQDSSGNHQGPGGCVNWADPTGWHVYAAHWEPGKITYYYDGQQVGTITQGVVSAQHFLILNYGVNDRYGINVPATMEVDYVRVWKKGSGTPTIPPTSTPIPNVTGDANNDRRVDGLDYIIWLSHYNQQVTNGSSSGDFNNNGMVDGVDYVIWLQNYI